MEKKESFRRKTMCIYLSQEEEEILRKVAIKKRMPLAAYIRAAALDSANDLLKKGE